tara:strand:- start:272 stop:517 length:246 start_codon:yes stop_codon:yes gene_type:complete
MLQKIVNGIAIASGVVSLTVVGTIGFVYINKDAIIDKIKTEALKSVGGAALGGIGADLVPSLPSPATPESGGQGGLSLPSF